MHSHPNARLTQRGRLRLVIQHIEHGRRLFELAAENGISLRCANRWLARYRSGGVASLADRRSVSRSQRRTLDPQQLQHAVDLRHQRLHLRHITRLLRSPFSTVARALSKLGLGRLRNLEPKRLRFCEAVISRPEVPMGAAWRTDPHRHLAEGFCEAVNPCPVPQGGPPDHWRPPEGPLQWGRLREDQVAVDDATRLAYVEVLADEQRPTVIGFLCRAVAWFNGQGVECLRVMSDNGPAYVFNQFTKACKALELWHILTRPYTPRTNGTAER